LGSAYPRDDDLIDRVLEIMLQRDTDEDITVRRYNLPSAFS
jgi:hypothetical protein